MTADPTEIVHGALEPFKLQLTIDTDVWIEIAKDCGQRPTITALEELVKANAIRLLVPRRVLVEFDRNKARIIKESRQSLTSTFRRVQDAVEQLAGRKIRKHFKKTTIGAALGFLV